MPEWWSPPVHDLVSCPSRLLSLSYAGHGSVDRSRRHRAARPRLGGAYDRRPGLPAGRSERSRRRKCHRRQRDLIQIHHRRSFYRSASVSSSIFSATTRRFSVVYATSATLPGKFANILERFSASLRIAIVTHRNGDALYFPLVRIGRPPVLVLRHLRSLVL